MHSAPCEPACQTGQCSGPARARTSTLGIARETWLTPRRQILQAAFQLEQLRPSLARYWAACLAIIGRWHFAKRRPRNALENTARSEAQWSALLSDSPWTGVSAVCTIDELDVGY